MSAWGSEHLLGALSSMSRCRYQGIEIYGDTSLVYADRPDEFRAILEIGGVMLAGVHSGGLLTNPDFHEAELEEWKRVLSWTAATGGRYAVYYGGDPTDDPDADLANAATLLNTLGEYAEVRGVQFCYEPDTTCPFNTQERLVALLDRTDPLQVRISADTARLAEIGLDPALFLLTQRKRIGVVHIRDLRAPGEEIPVGQDRYVEPGTGVIDLRAVADALKTSNYAGWIIGVVDRPAVPPRESANNTAKYFRTKLALEF